MIEILRTIGIAIIVYLCMALWILICIYINKLLGKLFKNKEETRIDIYKGKE